MAASFKTIIESAGLREARLLSCGDTQVMPPFLSAPWEMTVRALDRHAIFVHLGGDRDSPIYTRARGVERKDLRRPGTITVSPVGRERFSRAPDPFNYSAVMITAPQLDHSAEQLGLWRPVELIDRSCREDPTIVSLAALLTDEVVREEALPRAFFEQVADLICLQLIREHSVVAVGQRRPLSGLAGWQVKRVTDFMQENLQRDVGLQEFADILEMSRFHFCGAFRMATGSTPYAWLLQLRMNAAKTLLADPAMNITAISPVVGYSSVSAFTQAFRRVVGETPAQYRRGL